MATKNINTNSFASTNNNSKEENTMKANAFTQDCTHPYTFANLFYRAITLGEELSYFCTNEDYLNHRLALYVATGDMDPDPIDEVNFENTYKLTTSGVKTIEEHVPTITLHELEDRVYRTIKSFKNRRLEMHFRRSYDWITTNIPTFRYTFLERIFFGAIMNDYTIALKVFCNKDRTSIEDYVDINFAPAELDDRQPLTRIADINYDLLIMTNVTGMDEDDLLEIAQEKAEAGITLTFDDAYNITHPAAAADMTEICTATCDYHCIHWNECPFGKGEDDPFAGIYTTYAPDTDMTFIMQDTTVNGEVATTRVVGFYHGEPDDAATERFYGKLMADYVANAEYVSACLADGADYVCNDLIDDDDLDDDCFIIDDAAHALSDVLEDMHMIIADAIIDGDNDEDMKNVWAALNDAYRCVLKYVNDDEGPCVVLAEADLPGLLLILETIEADEIDNYLHPLYKALKKAVADFILAY